MGTVSVNVDLSEWGLVLRHVLELAAMVAFALSGVLEGARKHLDAVGVCVVAFLAALGGGTLRDLLLDQRPFFWVAHVEYVWGILGLSVVAVVFLRQHHVAWTERLIQWPDTLGLGLFVAVGVDMAYRMHMPALVAVLMGVITGVFGGVLRDIVCNEIPRAFHDHRPYALCAFAGGWLYWLLLEVGVADWMALCGCVLLTAGLRAAAVFWNWELPRWRL